MLPPATQRYIFEAFPDSFDLRTTLSDGTTRTGTFELHKSWEHSESTPEYPVLALGLHPTGVLRETQPISPVLERRDSTDPDIAYKRLSGYRVYDDLHVTLATKGYHDPTETTAHERMDVLARRIQQFCRFELPRTLQQGGPNRNEIPVNIPSTGVGDMTDTSGIVSSPSGSGAGEPVISRRTFTLQLNYTMSFIEDVMATEGVNIEVDTDTSDNTLTRIEVRFDSAD